MRHNSAARRGAPGNPYSFRGGAIFKAFRDLSRWKGRALDLLFPRACELCGTRITDAAWDVACASCAPHVEWIRGRGCVRCGAELEEAAGRRCRECAGKAYAFKGAVAAGRYEGFVRELVHRFKFGGRLDLARPLAERILDRLRGASWGAAIEVIVPVPMRTSKILFGRRYNPADVLAGQMARRLDRRLSRAVAQIRATPSQTRLTGEERLKNPQGAYRARREGTIRGRVVLLVDDVLTTGATASECARCLKETGAAAVYLAVVGR
ncbi:MAG: ComF family protein [Planctomycetes bacterium]|nr:ComF family protein [Planctomycetota bacterium]